MKRIAAIFSLLLLGMVVAGTTVWGALALYIIDCTTNIWLHTRVNPGHLPLSWKLLLSGHVPAYVYDAGKLDTSLPFPELQRRSLVNARARAADRAENFSHRIREGLPGVRAKCDERGVHT